MKNYSKIIIAVLWFIIAIFLLNVLTMGLNGKLGFNNFLIFKFPFWNSIESNVETIKNGPETEYAKITENIVNFDISLVNEDFNIEIWDNDYTEVTIVSSFTEDKRPKINMEGETLQIKVPKRNNTKLSYSKDSVTIKIPKKLAEGINEVDVNIVSGNVLISNIVSSVMKIESVSGEINVNESKIDKLNSNSVSGKTIVVDSSINQINSEAISGKIEIMSDISETFDLSTVSGKIIVESNVMPSLGGDSESISGSIEISIPENNGFALDFESTSGTITNEFTNSKFKKSGENLYKDGNIELEIETVSGNISILKK